MIQAIMLIALGFLTAALIGVLLAPSLWGRAYRLSKKRLESTLPLTLAEIEAAQDQLRATYAVRIRRLESSLVNAKQKAANQLVDNSRLHMQIVALKDQIADLEFQLSERRNAATVLEQTITRRFPELDREITTVKAQLQERSYELEDLTSKLARRDEEIEAAQAAAASYQEELQRLHQVLEKSAADRSGRRVRRASQWDLEDYRAEYDRLNLELSRLRQQLYAYQDRDAQQVGVIKGELQRLSELILSSAQPRTELTPAMWHEPPAKRSPGPDPRREPPVPWRESQKSTKSIAPKLNGEPRGKNPALLLAAPQPDEDEDHAASSGAGKSAALSPPATNLPDDSIPNAAPKNGHGDGGVRSKLLQEVTGNSSQQTAEQKGRAVERPDPPADKTLSKRAAGGQETASDSAAVQPEAGTPHEDSAVPQPAPAEIPLAPANGVQHPAEESLEDVINVGDLESDPEADRIGPHQPRLLERLRGVGG